MANVTLGGNAVGVGGNLPKRGETAPDFTLTAKDLKDVGLKEYAGKRKVLNIVPSLDTPTCRSRRAGSARPKASTTSSRFRRCVTATSTRSTAST